jgi:hypothetical protein
MLGMHIDPHVAMVRAGEGKGPDQVKQRIVAGRPEHLRIGDRLVLPRQDVVGALVPRRHIAEIGGVEPGVTDVRRVGPALEAACSTTPSLSGVTLVFTSG